MTRRKPKTKTIEISASELRHGHVIRIGPDAFTRVLEALSTGDLVSLRHVRTGTPRIERGMYLVFRKSEKVEILPEVQP